MYVRTLTGRHIYVSAVTMSTIGRLKSYICRTEGIPIEMQKIYTTCRLCQDDEATDENTTYFLVVNIRGGDLALTGKMMLYPGTKTYQDIKSECAPSICLLMPDCENAK
jgi:hypothetical protein